MPGHAARGGHPIPRMISTVTSVTDAPSNRPSASAPGEKSCPALRMKTKAEAHKTTVTAAAAIACRSTGPFARTMGRT